MNNPDFNTAHALFQLGNIYNKGLEVKNNTNKSLSNLF